MTIGKFINLFMAFYALFMEYFSAYFKKEDDGTTDESDEA